VARRLEIDVKFGVASVAVTAHAWAANDRSAKVSGFSPLSSKPPSILIVVVVLFTGKDVRLRRIKGIGGGADGGSGGGGRRRATAGDGGRRRAAASTAPSPPTPPLSFHARTNRGCTRG